MRSVFVLAILVGVAACRHSTAPEADALLEEPGPLPALQDPPEPVVAGDLLLESSANLWGDASSPVRIAVAVSARNTSSEEVALEGLCVLQFRAFSENSAAPVWRAPERPATSCPSPTGTKAIPPGVEFSLNPGGAFEHPLVRDVLGDSLSEGPYESGVLVRVGADTVAVPAGRLTLSADRRPPLQDPDLLTYAAEARVEGVAPAHLVARVVATNPRERNVYLEFGACALHLRAYRTPDLTGRPVWRSEYRRPPGSSYGYACPGYLATRLVSPGAVISPPEFAASIPLHEVLGDSLPDGRYYFEAVLRFQRGAGTTLAHDSVSVRAGGVDLSSAVDPLPQEREVGGILYRVETSRDSAAPGKLRLALTATNVGAERALILGSTGITCPVQLLGYRDAERRDRWYLEHRADWTARECPLRIPPSWLAPGESETFTNEVPGSMEEGELGPSYLALILWIEQEPQGTGSSCRRGMGMRVSFGGLTTTAVPAT